jgi:predicted DsbA family dithiol-disulfide isomerase
MYGEQAPGEEKPAVRWLPFQLNPDLPEEGISRREYRERKFGPGGGRSYSRVEGIGKELGIDFKFDSITVQPNTLNAHRLMLHGAKHGREDEVAESLFRAFFQEGANLADRATLAVIGERAGLDRAALEAFLASDEDNETVLNADIEARQAGISGVPYFIFNRRTAVSGAHEPETLLKAMMESLKGEAGTIDTRPFVGLAAEFVGSSVRPTTHAPHDG